MTPASQALALFDELRTRAGLEPFPLEPGHFTAMTFDKLLVSFRLPEADDTLHLLATVAIPSGREAEVLRQVMQGNAAREPGAGPLIGQDPQSGSLTLHQDIAVTGLTYPEFEKRLSDFVETCEHWTRQVADPGAGDTGGATPPHHAIYV